MKYYFRIYYLTQRREVMHKFKERFNCNVSVNGESYIHTDESGRNLILESERRGFVRIREEKTL